MKIHSVFLLLLFMSFNVFAAIIVDDRPAFHADVLLVSNDNVTKGKHYQGPNGFRFETETPGLGKAIIIANYKQKVCRVYFDFNKTYTEELLDTEHEGCDMGMEDMMEGMGAGMTVVQENSYYTLSSITPCQGFDMKRNVGTEEVSGHMTEQWQCMNTKTGMAAIQWFEPKMRHVIKHQSSEHEYELYSNIVMKPVSDTMLAPLSGYTKTTKKEVMNELMQLMQKQMQGQMQMPGGMGMPQY